MSGILRGTVSKVLPVARTNITQKATVISGPPRYQVKFLEKIGMATFMCLVTVTPAAWVLTHLKQYKKQDATESG